MKGEDNLLTYLLSDLAAFANEGLLISVLLLILGWGIMEYHRKGLDLPQNE